MDSSTWARGRTWVPPNSSANDRKLAVQIRYREEAARLRAEAERIESLEGRAAVIGARVVFQRDAEEIEDPVRKVGEVMVVLPLGPPTGWRQYEKGKVRGGVGNGLLVDFDNGLFRLVNHPDEARLRAGESVSGWFFETGEKSTHTTSIQGQRRVQVVAVVDYGSVPPVEAVKAAVEPLLRVTKQKIESVLADAESLERKAESLQREGRPVQGRTNRFRVPK